MDFIVTVLMLISFAFIILGIIGLVKPEKGGFWMKFVKEKKRIKVLGLNVGASVLFLILSGMVIPENPYTDGSYYLKANKFDKAIESYNKMTDSNEHFEEKEELIQVVYDTAKTYYQDIVDTAITNMDSTKALEANTGYETLTGSVIYSSEVITDKISKNIDSIKQDITNNINDSLYDDAYTKAKSLLKVPETMDYAKETMSKVESLAVQTIKDNVDISISENEYETALSQLDSLKKYTETKEYITSKTEEIKNVKFEYDKKQVETLISNEKFVEAQTLLDALLNDSRASEYASQKSDEIVERVTEQSIKEFGNAITKKDLDTAKSLLRRIEEMEGINPFDINDYKNQIKAIENEDQILTIINNSITYVRQGEFEKARTEVYSLSELGYDENELRKRISRINEVEKDYLAKKKEQERLAYIESAIDVEYTDLLRYPEKYQGKVIRLLGKILDKVDDNTYRLLTRYDSFMGYYDHQVVFQNKSGERIIPEDVLFVYGKFIGLEDYVFQGELPVVECKAIKL